MGRGRAGGGGRDIKITVIYIYFYEACKTTDTQIIVCFSVLCISRPTHVK